MMSTIAAFALAAALHPNSLSSSHVLVDGRRIELTLRCQLLSVVEVLPGVDADGDGRVTAAEVAASEQDILGYVGEHYEVWVGTDRELAGGRRLEPVPRAVRFLGSGWVDGYTYELGALDVELGYEAPEAVDDVMVAVSLFLDTSPAHIDIATLEWAGGASRTTALEPGSLRARFDPEGGGAFRAFAAMGIEHILSGWDHLAFVLVLILSARRLRSLLGVVTAFTLAHSVTLALASLGIVDTTHWSSFVEAAIALSIAYVAALNLVQREGGRSRWLEAFAFGLVHGLGFAGFLQASLVNEAARATALVSFNIGVEAGQLLVVLAVVLALRLLVRRRASEEGAAFLVPAALRRVGSGAVVVLGLYWFLERVA